MDSVSPARMLDNNTTNTTQQPNTTTQHNDTQYQIVSIHPSWSSIVIFTSKPMAEALGVAASVITVVELAGKVYSVCWQYYAVQNPLK